MADRGHRRDALLEAAARLFAERGYRAVGVDDIGAAVGISGPAVYRHFRSKEAILLALCVQATEGLLHNARHVVDGAADPRRTLERLVVEHVHFAVAQRRLLGVWLREQRELPAASLRRVRSVQRAYERLWQDALGRLRADLDAGERAVAVSAVLSLLNATPYARDGVPPAHLEALLHRMALAALLARRPPRRTRPTGRPDQSPGDAPCPS